MTLYAFVNENTVKIIKDREIFPASQDWRDLTGVDPMPAVGWIVNPDGSYSAPVAEAVVISPYKFVTKFTQAQRKRLRDARATDDIVDDFLYLLENFPNDVRSDDPNLIAGFQYFITPAFLSEDEAAVILGAPA